MLHVSPVVGVLVVTDGARAPGTYRAAMAQALFHEDYNAVEANVQAMLPQVAAAAEAGADIVVFPETVINGADSLPLNCTWQVRVGCV
jgi:hypothetical protein